MKYLSEHKCMGSISKCCQGIIHLNIRPSGVSLYFTDEAFMMLSDMISQARSNIILESVDDLLDNVIREE